MRILYSTLFYLILPFIFIRVYWRSLRQPAYRQRLKERLGFFSFRLEKSLWVHAVSMGETLAAVPLIKALQAAYPTIPILITTMTPTGSAQVRHIFKDQSQIYHVYLPYDLPAAMRRFHQHFNPIAGIMMETELWPNLIEISRQHHCAICLLNARLSERSARKYQYIKRTMHQMLQSLSLIAASSDADAKRFIQLNALKNKVIVTGNLKFDLQLPIGLDERIAHLKSELDNKRFIWIAASTHEGEENIILMVHQQLRKYYPDALLILVPRHPDRFLSVTKLARQYFPTQQRSCHEPLLKETAVYIGDTMGELLLLYGVADVAFIGGSLIPHGGHNMLEPAALRKAILIGPHVFNFQSINELMLEKRALKQIKNEADLLQQLIKLVQNGDERLALGEQAYQVFAANQGALAKQLAAVKPIIQSALTAIK